MHKFPRSRRLISATEFKQVWRSAKRYSSPYITVYSRFNDLGYPRLGLSLSKKQIHNATDRNRLKRLARELFRLSQTVLGSRDVVVVAYKGADALSKSAQYQQFADLWQRLTK